MHVITVDDMRLGQSDSMTCRLGSGNQWPHQPEYDHDSAISGY